MRYLIFLLALFLAPAYATERGINWVGLESVTTTPVHWVLLYGSPNITYACESREAYVAPDGGSYYIAGGCAFDSSDYTEWPVWPEAFSLYTAIDPKTPPLPYGCLFVAQANSANGNSSTVLDCR